MRGYEVDDAPAVFEAIQETRTSLLRWVPDIGRRQTLVDTRRGLRNLAAIPHGHESPHIFALWNSVDRSFLGEAGLYAIDHERRVGEVGYWLRQRARGFGFATEAVQLLLEYAITECGLLELEAHVAADNSASKGVVTRLGFMLARRRAPVPYWDGHVGEVLIYTYRPEASQGPSS